MGDILTLGTGGGAGDETTIHPAHRLKAIDHTTRNIAEVVNGIGMHTHELSRVSENLSTERRLMAGDRVKLEALYGPNGAVAKLEKKVDENHAETVSAVKKLSDKVVYAAGFIGGVLALVGMYHELVHH